MKLRMKELWVTKKGKAMKRFLLVLLCVCMVLSMVACGNNTNDNPTESQNVEQPSQPDGNENSTPTFGTEQKPADKYDSYAKVGGESIYVNYKTGRRDDTGASSIVFHSTATDIVVLAYDTTGSFSGDHLNALDFINDGRIFKDIEVYSGASFSNHSTKYTIVVSSTEGKTVNGLSMQKFTGTVQSEKNRACYAYGYAFVINGIPCVLAGFVLTEAQEQSLITAINVEVDTMMQSVRTER